MIIKYVHNGDVVCVHYDNEKEFLNKCYKPEFREALFNAKDIIVLDNNGTTYSFDSLLSVYEKYRCFIVE